MLADSGQRPSQHRQRVCLPIRVGTSELVANAVRHAKAETFDVDLLLLKDGSRGLVVVVFDPCARPPVKRDPARDVEQGRGLVVVDALATRWGWVPQDPGKAVLALFAAKEG